MNKRTQNKLCISLLVIILTILIVLPIICFSFKNQPANLNKVKVASSTKAETLNTKQEIESALNKMDYSSNSTDIIAKFDFNVASDITYQTISRKRHKNMTPIEIEQFREELNSYTYDYHREILSNYINDYKIKNAEIINYSPYISLSYDSINDAKDNIFKLSQIAEIDSIEIINNFQPETTDFIDEEETPEVSYTTMLSQINATTIVSSSAYTGNGVKIGIYESGGVADPSLFVGKNIIYKTGNDLKYTTYTSHANFVTSVFFGIAPNATVYTSPVDMIGIEWFINNRVSAVNCSFGYYRNTFDSSTNTYTRPSSIGYYNAYDGIYDYQVYSNYITVLKSAGNLSTYNKDSGYNPGNNISSPGYARNVVTVGGVTGSSTTSLTHASSASYVNSDGYAKPNISAPFTVTNPHGNSGSGTSYSTPQVTGAVALLFQKEPYLSLYPDQTAAALEASSTHEILSDFSTGLANHDNENGAGVLNIEHLLNLTTIESTQIYNNDNKDKNVLYKRVYLTAGQKIKISLYWLARFDVNANNLHFTDYDLHFSNSTSDIATSSSGTSNNELIMYTATSDGYYQINVYQYGNFTGTGFDFIGLAYKIY